MWRDRGVALGSIHMERITPTATYPDHSVTHMNPTAPIKSHSSNMLTFRHSSIEASVDFDREHTSGDVWR